MGDLVHPAPPFFDGLIACVHGQANAFQMEVVVEFSDGWCGLLIHQGMVDIADSRPGIDAGKSINGKNFFEPWSGGSYTRISQGDLEDITWSAGGVMKLRGAHWKVSRC